LDRCPQATETGANDDEISVRDADEGIGTFWDIGIVSPEDLGLRIGDSFADVDQDHSFECSHCVPRGPAFLIPL
jgi:hypothetical protein